MVDINIKNIILFIVSLYILYYIYIILYVIYFIKTKNLKIGEGFINFAYIFKEIYINGDYNIGLNLNNCTVFDVGGNMGLFSLWINDHYSNMNVYVFEPIPATYKLCLHNITTNKKSNNNFTINNFGLSNKNEIVKMNYYIQSLTIQKPTQ
jgi:hypothetical protein